VNNTTTPGFKVVVKSKDYASKIDDIVNHTSLTQARANRVNPNPNPCRVNPARFICYQHHLARVQGGGQVKELHEQI